MFSYQQPICQRSTLHAPACPFDAGGRLGAGRRPLSHAAALDRRGRPQQSSLSTKCHTRARARDAGERANASPPPGVPLAGAPRGAGRLRLGAGGQLGIGCQLGGHVAAGRQARQVRARRGAHKVHAAGGLRVGAPPLDHVLKLCREPAHARIQMFQIPCSGGLAVQAVTPTQAECHNAPVRRLRSETRPQTSCCRGLLHCLATLVSFKYNSSLRVAQDATVQQGEC